MKRKVTLLALAMLTACAGISLATTYPTNSWGYSAADVNGLIQQRIDALNERSTGSANSTNLNLTVIGDADVGTNLTVGGTAIVTGDITGANLSTVILAGQSDTNASFVLATGATIYTPRRVGDVLVQTVSNVVYISDDITTNGWIQLNP